MRYCFGVDLGTSTVEVSYCREVERHTEVKIVKFFVRMHSDSINLPDSTDGNIETLPAVIYVDEDDTQIYGRDALNAASRYPERLHDFHKRDWINGDKGKKGFRFTAREVTALLLKKAVEAIEYYLIYDISGNVSLKDIEVTFTVPLAYGPSDIQEIFNAAEEAGLKRENIRYRYEAEAVICNYIYENQQEGDGDSWEKFKGGKKVLVYDMGGGTLDISLVTIKSLEDENGLAEYEILTHRNGKAIRDNVENVCLAGKDFDDKFTEVLYKKFMDETHWNEEDWFTEESENIIRKTLRIKAAEEIKKIVDRPLQRDVTVQLKPAGKNMVSHTMRVERFGREAYRQALAPMFECTGETPYVDILTPINNTLAILGKRMRDIDIILLSGGMSQLSLVKETIEDFLKRNGGEHVRVERVKDPVHAVANGAAYAYYLKIRKAEEMRFSWLMDVKDDLPRVIIPNAEKLPLFDWDVDGKYTVSDRRKIRFRLFIASQDEYSADIRCEYDIAQNLQKPIRSDEYIKFNVSILEDYAMTIKAEIFNQSGEKQREEIMVQYDASHGKTIEDHYNPYVFKAPFCHGVRSLREDILYLRKEFNNCSMKNASPLQENITKWVKNALARGEEKNPILFLLVYASKCIDTLLMRMPKDNPFMGTMVKLCRMIVKASEWQEECMAYLIQNLRWEPQLAVCMKAVNGVGSERILCAAIGRAIDPAFELINEEINIEKTVKKTLNYMIINYLNEGQINKKVMRRIQTYIGKMNQGADRYMIKNIGKAARNLDNECKSILMEAFYGREKEQDLLEEGFNFKETESDLMLQKIINRTVSVSDAEKWFKEQMESGDIDSVLKAMKCTRKPVFSVYASNYLRSSGAKKKETVQNAAICLLNGIKGVQKSDAEIWEKCKDTAPFEYLSYKIVAQDKAAAEELIGQVLTLPNMDVVDGILNDLFQITGKWMEEDRAIRNLIRNAVGSCFKRIMDEGNVSAQMVAAENLERMMQFRNGSLVSLFDFHLLPIIFRFFHYDDECVTEQKTLESIGLREVLLDILKYLYPQMNEINRNRVDEFIDDVYMKWSPEIAGDRFFQISSRGEVPESNRTYK